MKERTKFLWAIGSIISGALMAGLTYNIILKPYWLNNVTFSLAFALMAVGIGYLFIKLLFKLFY